MNTATLFRNTLVLTALPAVLLACGGSETPTDAEYDQTASELTAVASHGDSGERALLGGAIQIGRSGDGDDLDVEIDGRLGGRRGSLEIHVDVSCTAADGASLERCGDGADAASFDLEIAGDLTLPRASARLSRTAQWELVGLSGPVTTIDGQSTLQVEHTQEVGEGERWNIIDARLEYRDVQVDNQRRELLAGEISYQLDLSRGSSGAAGERTRELTVDALLEVVAEGDARLTLDGTHTYQVDLATGRMSATGR